MISALAPKMLALAGRECAGTITWMTGAKTIAEHTAPRIRASADEAGRAAPRIVAGLPVCVCDSAEEARAQASKTFAVYNTLPSYRAMLDREGGGGPESIAVVGTEEEVARQLDGLATAGVTDFLGAPFTMGPDKAASYERTRAFLQQRANG